MGNGVACGRGPADMGGRKLSKSSARTNVALTAEPLLHNQHKIL